ncbi:MAG: tRNA (pseudouridine(54)-N(1))-methyltransferase TrmY [Euryarchaeota archaeon]|nr:tRNA (pseudouridine(54)-N(1))-methyltransferase TrmY [Euryarchaeota archaeon]
MRAFAVIAHKFRGDINLNDLPGSGRVDVIARCINSAIFLSHDIRRDVLFYMFAPRVNFLLNIDSSRVKYLNPDERSTAALIRNAYINLGRREESSPGFFPKTASFDEFIAELDSRGTVYYLHEHGRDVRDTNFDDDAVFVLSDSVNLSDEEESRIRSVAEDTLSVGPRSILASHAITIVHNELDRRGL